MNDMIHVLPDVVANQIAAGEVIQRPASVIKELVENAVDAGSSRIQVIVKDAGRTLMQIVDNGCGMSENDARLCFERHATSKIKIAEDLFSIRTMGFRGEALASIASVAQVEMKTRRTGDETGTHLRIEGSDLKFQQPVACSNGTSISVKNLFYNVPARRRFLKSNNAELKHIITEFQRIALTHPDIRFSLHHNDSEIYQLIPSGLRERIVHLMGKSLDANLVKIDTNTSIIKVSGYIGKPEKAKKKYGEQFFFVNGRFMKHPYLHKAVMKSYESVLPPETIPSYFIYMETDPSHVDINIHPTKTEIKFDEEAAIFQIMQASVKESLGKFNITPTLDFNQDGAIDIPVFSKKDQLKAPEISVDPTFNPFDPPGKKGGQSSNRDVHTTPARNLPDWEKLYPEKSPPEPSPIPEEEHGASVIQIKGKFLLTPIKSGLMVIHIRRALERIHYDHFLENSPEDNHAQKLLYPRQFELNPADIAILSDLKTELQPMGFEIEHFGGQSIIVHSVPAEIGENDLQQLLEHLLEELKAKTSKLPSVLKEKLSLSLAKVTSVKGLRTLHPQEMKDIIDQLFSCKNPQTTPGGKKIMTILQAEEIEQRF